MADALDKARTERNRQVEQLRYNDAHDDKHDPLDLIDAGTAYIEYAKSQLGGSMTDMPPYGWPEGWEFKPSPDYRRNLTKGIALIAAGQDRAERETPNG